MDLAYAKKTLFYKNKPYTVISEFWYDVENDDEFQTDAQLDADLEVVYTAAFNDAVAEVGIIIKN